METPYWYRRVFLLAIPLILSNLTQPLLSTVDTILSGHLPGPAALGGVAVGGIFFNSIYWTFGFLRMATTGLVAQSHGAADQDQVVHHFGRALLTAMLVGALLLAIQRPLISGALVLFGAAPRCRGTRFFTAAFAYGRRRQRWPTTPSWATC
jgi:multidrug resistance protein, MATE family